MEKDFQVDDVKGGTEVSLPANWCFCFNDGCILAGSCFRRFATLHLAGGRKIGTAVFPGTAGDGVCNFFLEKRIVRMAWGLDKLFEKVYCNDATPIRQELLRILGNKGGYYRYNRGEKWLSPEQQERVSKVFSRYGYEHVEFGHYQNRFWLGD